MFGAVKAENTGGWIHRLKSLGLTSFFKSRQDSMAQGLQIYAAAIEQKMSIQEKRRAPTHARHLLKEIL